MTSALELAGVACVFASRDDASQRYTAVRDVTLTVTDPTQLQPSEYELVQSGGAWQLTRRLDGFTQTVVDGSVVDGFQINLGTPPPAATA